MPSPASRRLTVPVIGDGTLSLPVYGAGPHRPKYSDDGGVDGYEYAVYDPEQPDLVTATFHGDPAVLDAIAAEPDVVAVEDVTH